MNKNAYKKRMNRYDDVLAARKWWSWLYMHCLWKEDDNAIAREVLGVLPDDFQGEILDVPVGTAVFTAEKYGRMKNTHITGLDYSQEVLDIAQYRITETKLSNLKLVQGDVGCLPFEDNHFDCVLSMNGFHVFPDKPKAFSETFRVLKPGGLFLSCFYIKGERRPADWFVRNFLDKKGFFSPPHYTFAEAEDLLGSIYGKQCEIKHYRSILVCKCVK